MRPQSRRGCKSGTGTRGRCFGIMDSPTLAVRFLCVCVLRALISKPYRCLCRPVYPLFAHTHTHSTLTYASTRTHPLLLCYLLLCSESAIKLVRTRLRATVATVAFCLEHTRRDERSGLIGVNGVVGRVRARQHRNIYTR